MGKILFSTTQAAKLFGVTPGTIIYWVKKGKLETTLTAGGHRRISDHELLRVIKSLRLATPTELAHLEDKHRTLKVLVVDDEPSIRQLIQWIFKEHFPKAEVEIAEDGLVAGWKTMKFYPDLILLDLMMPGLDGFRFCELVRTTAPLKKARIIAMSGVQGFDFKEKILRIGANDFLAKPFDVEVLKQKIAEQLRALNSEKKEEAHGA